MQVICLVHSPFYLPAQLFKYPRCTPHLICSYCVVPQYCLSFQETGFSKRFPSSAETTGAAQLLHGKVQSLLNEMHARSNLKKESNGTLIAVIVVACISSHHDVVAYSICEHDDILWGERERWIMSTFFVNNCCMMIRSTHV